jgi:hypothetical protein
MKDRRKRKTRDKSQKLGIKAKARNKRKKQEIKRRSKR